MSINFLADLEMIDNHDYEDAINKEIKESLETGRWGICYRHDLKELFSGLDHLCREIGAISERMSDLEMGKWFPGDMVNSSRWRVKRDAIQRLIVIAAKREEH